MTRVAEKAIELKYIGENTLQLYILLTIIFVNGLDKRTENVLAK